MKLTKKAYTVRAVDYQSGEIRTQVVIRTSKKRAINAVKAELCLYADDYEYSVTEVRTIRAYCKEQVNLLSQQVANLSELVADRKSVAVYVAQDIEALSAHIQALLKY